MDIKGKWKIAEALRFLEKDGKLVKEWQKVEDIFADPEFDPSDGQMLKADVLFNEDGSVSWILPIPEGVTKEQIDEAVAAGEIKLFNDNSFVVSENAWKEEDGVLKFNSGIKGEIFGEAADPWVEIEEVGDGMIEVMMYHMVRA